MFETIIVKPIFNALMLLYSIVPGGDFGLAIIFFTIIIRFLMYPLVKKQLHQTKQMRKMQPELKKIKERAAGNRQLEATMQMELYKRYGINPFQSILILIIQLPIFIALYQVIQIMTLHRDKLVHYMYEPVKQIDAIKTIIQDPANFNQTMLGFIDLTKTTFANGKIDIALLTLALVSAATQYILMKQTMPNDPKNAPKKFRNIMKDAADGKEADAADMSAMMTGSMAKFMPVMMLFIMVGLPGALALYYTVANVIAVVQQHYLLNKDEEELDMIADQASEITQPTSKKMSAKARAKQAKEGNITRIKAKG